MHHDRLKAFKSETIPQWIYIQQKQLGQNTPGPTIVKKNTTTNEERSLNQKSHSSELRRGKRNRKQTDFFQAM